MSVRPNSNRSLGSRGEAAAARYLQSKGFTLLARNYRTSTGEIDLIAHDGPTLVFVEVKLRRGLGHGYPAESVTPRNQAKIRQVAEEYLANVEASAEPESARFDVVELLVSGNRARVRHIEDAF